MDKKILFLIILLALALRLYKIGSFPPLYSDEAAYGYNSYSILKTARDEYGNFFPLTFKSFGDYKPPLTAWATIPSIFIFGLNDFAIRLPSALAGTATVIIIYFLTAQVFASEIKKNSFFKYLPFASSFLLAVSPWHLHFSKSSMLVGLEIMFIAGGLLLFLKGLEKRKYLIFSSIFFSSAIYTYYGARITVFLLVLFLFFVFRKKLLAVKKTVILCLFLSFLLLSPLLVSIIKEPKTLLGRAKTVSIFFDSRIKIKLEESHIKDGRDFPPQISRFFHNKLYFYSRDVLRRYSQHFSVDFLGASGDHNQPFDIPNMGIVYLIEIPFFLFGLFLIVRNPTPAKTALLAYFLISPVAASFSFITPAANRSANMVIGWSTISAYGFVHLLAHLKSGRPNYLKLSATVLAMIYFLSYSYYFFQYYLFIPTKIPENWYFGRKELVSEVSRLQKNYQKVVVTEKESPNYIWFLLYNKYDPQKYWQSAKISGPDKLGWLHVESFDKYVFTYDFNWEKIEKSPDVLYAVYGEQLPDKWQGTVNGSKYKLLIDKKILYPYTNTAYKIGHLEKY